MNTQSALPHRLTPFTGDDYSCRESGSNTSKPIEFQAGQFLARLHQQIPLQLRTRSLTIQNLAISFRTELVSQVYSVSSKVRILWRKQKTIGSSSLGLSRSTVFAESGKRGYD